MNNEQHGTRDALNGDKSAPRSQATASGAALCGNNSGTTSRLQEDRSCEGALHAIQWTTEESPHAKKHHKRNSIVPSSQASADGSIDQNLSERPPSGAPDNSTIVKPSAVAFCKDVHAETIDETGKGRVAPYSKQEQPEGAKVDPSTVEDENNKVVRTLLLHPRFIWMGSCACLLLLVVAAASVVIPVFTMRKVGPTRTHTIVVVDSQPPTQTEADEDDELGPRFLVSARKTSLRARHRPFESMRSAIHTSR